MIDRIKGLVNNSNDLYVKSEEDSLNLSNITIDMEMNKNAEERYRALTKLSRKINLGIKLADYHIKWRDSLETDKRNKILEQLEYIFPNEFFDNLDEHITDESLTEKISEFGNVLSEIDITINMRDIVGDNHYFMKSVELNTCPLFTQIGMGKDELEASWKALFQMKKSLILLLS